MSGKIKLVDVKPDDVASAMAYYRQGLVDGTWNRERARALFGLQRDPDALIAAIATSLEVRAPRGDDWDESQHPRAPDGKFGESSGAGAGGRDLGHGSDTRRGRIVAGERQEAEHRAITGSLAQVGHTTEALGTPADWQERRRLRDQHAAVLHASGEMSRVHAEAEARGIASAAAIDLALKEGHIEPVSHEAEQAMLAAHDEHQETVRGTQTHIDEAAQAALDAAAKYDVYATALDEEHEPVGSELTDALHDARGAAGNDEQYDTHAADDVIADLPDAPEPDQAEFVDGDAPKRGDYDTAEGYQQAKGEHEDQLKEYERSLSEHKQEYERARQAVSEQRDRYANEAQEALQTLHERQVAALAPLSASGKKLDKAIDSYREEAEVDPADIVHVDDERMQETADEYLRDEQSRRESVLDGLGRRDEDDRTQSLKDAAKQTVAAIKRMSKVTGREPRVAKPKAKIAKSRAKA